MPPAQTPFGIAIVLRARVCRSTRSTMSPAAAHIEPNATTAWIDVQAQDRRQAAPHVVAWHGSIIRPAVRDA